jgi:hypothetical protein
VCSVVLYTIQGSMISGVEVLVSVMQLMAKKLTGGLKRMVMCSSLQHFKTKNPPKISDSQITSFV